jgi:hypothetical protein
MYDPYGSQTYVTAYVTTGRGGPTWYALCAQVTVDVQADEPGREEARLSEQIRCTTQDGMSHLKEPVKEVVSMTDGKGPMDAVLACMVSLGRRGIHANGFHIHWDDASRQTHPYFDHHDDMMEEE